MKQLQIDKIDLARTRIVEAEQWHFDVGEGEIRVRVESFGFSANNITYGVAGETLKYWHFFKPTGENNTDWGVLPVWGFAEVEASNVDELKVGERLFGYFPPATHLLMVPEKISDGLFVDGAEHRTQLPRGYNTYRRIEAEPGYDRADDQTRMLLYPLYLTSFCLWDLLKENGWYGAEQIVVASASSKTSLGLAYALNADAAAPHVVGLTSKRNLQFIENLGIYDECVDYDVLEQQVSHRPTVIVDMSGNAEVLGRLHAQLGKDMLQTLNVGLTHWESSRRDENIIRERSEFFFAPSQVQKRMKEWGAEKFTQKSAAFIQETAAKSASWLDLINIQGLEGLEKIYPDILNGKANPQHGYLIKL